MIFYISHIILGGDIINKILVTINESTVYFSKCNLDLNQEDLNNTNVIDTKNLKFTEEYIKENLELMANFFNLVLLKFKVNKVIIKSNDIAEVILQLVNNFKSVKYIYFSEDKCLGYSVSFLLLQNNNLDFIECYNLPEIMLKRFPNNIIHTRCQLSEMSSFFKYNNIKTYSDIYNKKSILISTLYNSSDIEDITYFFENNRNLKYVEFKPYNKTNFSTILKLINKNNSRKISIIIYEDDNTTQEILNDIPSFDKLNKKFNVEIKVKYSKSYKEKNQYWLRVRSYH